MAKKKSGFHMTVKQANRLRGRITAFNNAVKRAGLDERYLTNYKKVMEDISSKAGVEQAYNRMGRLLKPGATRILTNKNGVSMSVWERNELNYTRQAANRMQKKLDEQSARVRNGRAPVRHLPYTRTWQDISTGRDIFNLLDSYIYKGRRDYLDMRNELVRQNLIQAASWMAKFPQYNELVKLFQNMDINKLIAAVEDPYQPVSINHLYLKTDAENGGFGPEVYDFVERQLEYWRDIAAG